jgi:site-specific DNA-adenine methylase
MTLGIFQNSPLGYTGSKSRRAVRLLRLADQNQKHYIEPFAGGLGMLFRARRERLFKTYSANDKNADLINFYTVLRDYPEELSKLLWGYYQVHGSENAHLFAQSLEDLTSGNNIKRAAAFLIVDKCAAKGTHPPKMIRSSTRRHGVTPLMVDRLPLFSELLENATLTCLDYRQLDIPKTAFVFADPPYEAVGAKIYEHRVDLQAFSEWAKQMDCSWLVSLNDSEYTNSLFRKYDRIVEPVSYPAIIDPKSGCYQRRDATEVLILNYHRPARDAFLRQFGWSIKPAKERPTRCSTRAG